MVSRAGPLRGANRRRASDRQREALVGTYVERGHEALVRPNDPSLPGPIRVPRTQIARDGDVVKVRLGVGADLLTAGRACSAR